jgi:hypothetical protein
MRSYKLHRGGHPMSEEKRISPSVNTDGGAYIGGSVNTGGGNFIGRDQISIGDIQRSKVGFERGAQAQTTVGPTTEEINHLFGLLLSLIYETPILDVATARLQAELLRQELGRGIEADDAQLARLIDSLARYSSALRDALINAFTTTSFTRMRGPVTQFVIERLQVDPE